MKPEQNARIRIDALLAAAGWHVCDVDNAHIHAATGTFIREVGAEVDVNLQRAGARTVDAQQLLSK